MLTQARIWREVLTPMEVADYLRIGRTQAYQRIRDCEIPSFRIGRSIRVRRSDVEAYAERLSSPATEHAGV